MKKGLWKSKELKNICTVISSDILNCSNYGEEMILYQMNQRLYVRSKEDFINNFEEVVK